MLKTTTPMRNIFDAAHFSTFCITLHLGQVTQFGAFNICKSLHGDIP